MSYFSKDSYTIVSKHFVFLFFSIIKFIYLLLIAVFIIYLFKTFWHNTDNSTAKLILFLFVYIIIFYSFINFGLWLVVFYNSLFILNNDQVYIINSSLFIRDEIEIIDVLKIIEVDKSSKWIFANLLWFWTIKIELQTKEERIFKYIPHPYKLLNKLKHQKERAVEDRKKKYIIEEEKLIN